MYIRRCKGDNKYFQEKLRIAKGACVNAPLVQINNDYHENLTPELMENLIDKLSKNIDLALKFGKINTKTISADIIKGLIEKEGIKDAQVLNFAKLNPIELDNGNENSIMHAINLGKTELADKLIEILEEYQNSQIEHADL